MFRTPRFETLESRRVLTLAADVVFLVDLSTSSENLLVYCVIIA